MRATSSRKEQRWKNRRYSKDDVVKQFMSEVSMASTDKTGMGAFVIGGVLLFGFGLFLIGDRRMLFSKSADYYTEFAQISALEAGAKVRVGGMDAGELIEIRVPEGPGSKFRLKFRDRIEKLFPVIRTDSIASIQTDGLLGNKFLLIDTGRPAWRRPGVRSQAENRLKLATSCKIRETVKAIDMTVGLVKGDVGDATRTVAETAVHVDEIIVAAQAPLNRFTVAAARCPKTRAPSSRASGQARVLSASS